MKRILPLIGIMLWGCLSSALAAKGGEKLLVGFEKDEVKKWITFCEDPKNRLLEGKPKRKLRYPGEYTEGSFAFTVFAKGQFKTQKTRLSAKGNASQGEYALSYKMTDTRSNPGEILPHYPLCSGYTGGGTAPLIDTLGWPQECYAKDWSGFDYLWIDIWCSEGLTAVWLHIEDELVEPPVSGTYKNIPKGTWVTLEIDLNKAVAERGLDLKKMLNIWIHATGPKGNVLMDNFRLAKKGAKAKGRVLKDDSPMKLPDPPTGTPVNPKPSFKPDRSKLKPEKPCTIKTGTTKGTYIAPIGWVAAFDNKHLMVAYTERYHSPLQVLQTTDGGKTWKGIKGDKGPTKLAFGEVTHQSSNGAIMDSWGNSMVVSSMACSSRRPSPRGYALVFTFQGDKGWEVSEPVGAKKSRYLTYKPGMKKNLVDADIRHCLHNGSSVRLDSGIIWHAWGHIDRKFSMPVHVKYSIDNGTSWHCWQHGRVASIPGSHGKPSYDSTNYYSYKQPSVTEWENGIAVFWQEQITNPGGIIIMDKCIKWSRFDGKKWSEIDTIDIKPYYANVSSGKGAKPYGVAITLGKEIFLSNMNLNGVLHYNGTSWKNEIPEAGGRGFLSKAGKTLVYVSPEVPKGKRTRGLSAKLRYWKRAPGGGWKGPVDITEGKVEFGAMKGYPGFRLPRISPPNFVPVVWSEKGSNDLKLVRIPVE